MVVPATNSEPHCDVFDKSNDELHTPHQKKNISTVTTLGMMLDPLQMLDDPGENARRIKISTASASTDHSDDVSPFSLRATKPLIKWPTTVSLA